MPRYKNFARSRSSIVNIPTSSQQTNLNQNLTQKNQNKKNVKQLVQYTSVISLYDNFVFFCLETKSKTPNFFLLKNFFYLNQGQPSQVCHLKQQELLSVSTEQPTALKLNADILTESSNNVFELSSNYSKKQLNFIKQKNNSFNNLSTNRPLEQGPNFEVRVDGTSRVMYQTHRHLQSKKMRELNVSPSVIQEVHNNATVRLHIDF